MMTMSMYYSGLVENGGYVNMDSEHLHLFIESDDRKLCMNGEQIKELYELIRPTMSG